MNQEEYNMLVNQMNNAPNTVPSVIHPGQTIQEINDHDEITDEIETPVIDNQKLTAEEIQQINQELQKLQTDTSQ